MDRTWWIEISNVFGGRIFGCENSLVVLANWYIEEKGRDHVPALIVFGALISVLLLAKVSYWMQMETN